jgi:hypothetical protein
VLPLQRVFHQQGLTGNCDERDGWFSVFHIHIGAHKVGSTSLQRFFALNAGLLAELGIEYPRVGLGSYAHHPLGKAFTESKQVTGRQALITDLSVLAKAAPEKTFLISSEVFEFARAPGINDLAQSIAPHDVQILIYLRDFTKLIPSKYAQRTKTGGNHKNFDDFLNIAHEMRWLGFSKLAATWANQFGWDALRIRVLEKDSLEGGDLLRDAWSALGLPAAAFERCDPASLEPVNTSPGWVALEAVREVNRRLSEADLGLPTEGKTRGMKRARAKSEARVVIDTFRVNKLVDVCAEAAKDIGVADKPGRYLTRDQWIKLNGLYRREIERLNASIVGPPLPLPDSRPPDERPFLPRLSELTREERARLGRRVVASRAVKRLPRPVIEVIASAFGVRGRFRRGANAASFGAGAIAWLKSIVSPQARPVWTSRKREVAVARAAAERSSRKRQGTANQQGAANPEGAANRPTLLRRLKRRLTRWSRRLPKPPPAAS